MRHKISHDRDLPTLKSLRTAMEFVLDWLKVRCYYNYFLAIYNSVLLFQTKYWNIDDNFSVVGPKTNMDIVDVFMDTIEFYILNKRQTNTCLKEDQLNVLR